MSDLHRHDIELGADDAGDFYRLAVGDGGTALIARRRGVARAGLDVGDFTHTVRWYRRDDGARHPNECGDAGFTRAVHLVKERPEKPNHPRRNDERAQDRERGADPRTARGLDARENKAQAAKGGNKGGNGGRAEGGQSGHASILEAGLGMAARPDINVRIVSTAEKVAEETADQGEEQPYRSEEHTS